MSQLWKGCSTCQAEGRRASPNLAGLAVFDCVKLILTLKISVAGEVHNLPLALGSP